MANAFKGNKKKNSVAPNLMVNENSNSVTQVEYSVSET